LLIGEPYPGKRAIQKPRNRQGGLAIRFNGCYPWQQGIYLPISFIGLIVNIFFHSFPRCVSGSSAEKQFLGWVKDNSSTSILTIS